MNRTRTTSHHRSRHRRRLLGRGGPLATIVMTLGLSVTACGGGDDGASATTTTTAAATAPGGSTPEGSAPAASEPASSQPAAGEPDPFAYSQCMRDEGIANFPDPDPEGNLSLDGDSLGVDPQSPQFEAAEEACQHLMPPQDPADRQEIDMDAMLEYAQCMRDEGISNFPDPDAEGGFELGDAVDPFSPQVKAAEEACKHLLPGGGEGGSFDSGGEG
jgi:hypothetical protein